MSERVLDWARSESGKKTYRREPMEVRALVEATLSAFRAQRLDAPVQLSCELESTLPTVRVDREAIAGALLNLMQNAFKYTGVEKKIAIRARSEPHGLSILTGLSMNLKFEGYEVLQAQDGRTGLQRALDERPDLLVLDIMLPQMNGYEVIRELRQRGRDIPVVMLSARGMEHDKILGLELGADDYVVKPFALHELLARIKAGLKRQQRAGECVAFGGNEVDRVAKGGHGAGEPVNLLS